MQMKLYTVRDIKTGIYEVPLAQLSHGEAERTFQTLLKDPKSKLSLHPQDYDLIYLGDYENLTGAITPKDSEFIMNGAGIKSDALNN